MSPAGVFAGVFLVLALYYRFDPFNHSEISRIKDFKAYRVDPPAWSEVPVEKDTQNLLQKSEIKFLNQIQGPESIAFDPNGRGPYTGIADGRIVLWDGEKWTDFAYTSANRNYILLVYSAEASGRVLKYNPSTKQTTVLVQNLQFPNGLSLSKDGSFFVFCEVAKGRLQKYWLKGEKSGTSEVMAVLPGYPDNVSTNEGGEFWVALHCRRNIYIYINSMYPQLRLFLLKLPIPVKLRSILHSGGKQPAIVAKYSPEGKLLQILEDEEGKVVRAVSDVEEKDGKLWMGSVLMPFIAVYKLE